MAFYTGIALPYLDVLYPVEKDDERLIADSVRTILLTKIGQRHMVPDFGSRVWNFVFEPNDTTTFNLIREAIVESLRIWEPRVEVISVLVDMDEHVLHIGMRLLIRRINRLFDLPLDISRDAQIGSLPGL